MTIVPAVFAVALGCAASAQPAPRLRIFDLNRDGQSSLSAAAWPRGIIAAGNTAYFPARTIESGTELFRSDGTPGGTRLVADLNPGAGSSSIGELYAVGSLVVFAAFSAAEQSTQVFVSDGTAGGTRIVLPIHAPAGGDPRIYIVGATPSLVFFAANDDAAAEVGGGSLWRTDGTPEGTFQVRTFSITEQSGLALPFESVALGDRLFFAATDDGRGAELWSTDGTADGTRLVADIAPGPTSSSPRSLAAAAGRVFFAADDGVHGLEPWVTDGISTRLLGDIAPPDDNNGSSDPAGFVAFDGSTVFFTARRADTGRELWCARDSEESAHLVLDARPGPASGLGTLSAIAFGGRFYFAADNGTTGVEPWSMDPSGVDAAPLADLYPGAGGSSPDGWFAFRDALYLQAFTTSSTGRRLFRIGPSGGVPEVLAAIGLDEYGYAPSPVVIVNNTMLFPGFTRATGLELFRSDGTGAGTSLVLDLRPGTNGSSPQGFTQLGNTGAVVFGATTELFSEPWITDSSAEHTHVIADLFPGGSSNPGGFMGGPGGPASPGDVAVFSARSQWYRTDGTSAGTIPLGASSGSAGGRLASGLFVFVSPTSRGAPWSAGGYEPWVSDGSVAGTHPLIDLVPGASSSSPQYFARTPDNASLFFFARNAAGRTLIYRTDGTPAGTVVVGDPLANNPPGTIQLGYLRGVDLDRLFFVATDQDHGTELWIADADGPRLVKDIRPGPESSNPYLGASLGGRLVFSTLSATDMELWISDGTPDGTRLLTDINPSGAASIAAFAAVRPGRIYFTATTSTLNNQQLWTTDGTVAGTIPLTNIPPGGAESFIRGFTIMGRFGNRTVFSFRDGSLTDTLVSSQVWSTDDTPAGTRRITSSTGGLVTAAPTARWAQVRNRLYFASGEPSIGSEPAILDFAPVDFDNSGGVTVSDIFAYLQAFIPAIGQAQPNLAADFNADGVVSLDDLFGYLAAYFAP